MRLSQHILLALLVVAALLLSACAAQTPQPANAVIVTPPPTAISQSAPQPYRIVTGEAGVYRLDSKTLQSIGFGTASPENLRLTHQGEDWPFAYTQDGLYFYAPALRTRYANENVFILWGDGTTTLALQPEALPATPAQASAAYPASLRLEENSLYEPKAEQGDHWLWQKLVAPTTWEQAFTLADVQPGAGTLTITLWGNSGRAIVPEGEFDHHWRVSLNGQVVLEQTWSQPGAQTFTADLPDGLLHEGENHLKIEAVADSSLPVDITTLDAVEITIPRRARLQEGMLRFAALTDGVQVEDLKGEVYLWDIGNPQKARLFVGDAAPSLGVTADHRYVLHTPQGALSPLELAPAEMNPDLRVVQGAAYLAIGAPPLLDAAQPLLKQRAAQGLSTLTIPLQAVYDQFSGGIVTPEAIHALLQYAVQHWETRPQYVLLLGDYTYDTYGYQTALDYPLPGFMVFTTFGGETVSDVLFAQLDDDLRPDIAIGRIPAQTPQQVQAYVEKVLAYEAQPAGDWQQRVLAVADGQEAYFEGDASAFLDVFSANYQTELYTPPAGSTDASQQVQAYLQEGAWLVAYFGHGSLNQWGKDRIFTTDDVPGLKNKARLPIVVNMTCLTGFFTHPTVESLAETLLFAPNGGAVAMLAPTSLTLAADQSTLSTPFTHALLDATGKPLGDAFLNAQRQVPTENEGSLDVLETFLLFGDPALTTR
ncbi:MAG: C25 family cysteine peptidase [Anaerolineales bacterium]